MSRSGSEGFAAVKRSHRIVELLAGRLWDGAGVKEIAEAIGTSAANACRDVAVLESIGYVRKLDNGLWALTTKPLSVMRRYALEYERAQARMTETMRNIEAGAEALGTRRQR